MTGGTGFIGGRLVQALRDRGDDVVVLVRSRSRATALIGLGCEIVEGDLNDRVAVERGVEGADAVFHLAAMFEIGLPKVDRPKMDDANIGGVRRVMDAAAEAGVARIVYASTINVFGDTRGKVVDETFVRDESRGFFSWYDRTKYQAHQLVMSRAAQGAPVVLVQPGVVYGPGDHFEIGREILLAAQGRLLALMLADIGITMSYVDDVVAGMLAAHDSGEIGESYVLGGENVRLREVLDRAARLAGRSLTRRTVPTSALKLVAPTAPLWAKRLGYPSNVRELIAVSDGKTYWVHDTKAREQLGYAPISLDEGLRRTLQHAGTPLANG